MSCSRCWKKATSHTMMSPPSCLYQNSSTVFPNSTRDVQKPPQLLLDVHRHRKRPNCSIPLRGPCVRPCVRKPCSGLRGPCVGPCGWKPCSGFTTLQHTASDGLRRPQVLGKLLVGEIFGMQLTCCRLKGPDAMTKFMIVLNSAMDGQDTERFPFSFFDRQGEYVDSLLTLNKRTDAEGSITGVFCFLHTTSVELLQVLTVQRATEKVAFAKLKELAYIRQEIKNPLYGVVFTRNLMEDTELSEDQRQFVETSAVFECQLRKILDDMDLESIEDGYLEVETTEFVMGTVMDAVVSQGMITSRENGLQLIRETPREIKTMALFGDQVRLQVTPGNRTSGGAGSRDVRSRTRHD